MSERRLLALEAPEPERSLPAPWRTLLQDRGTLAPTGETLRLVNVAPRAERYTNAQIDDYRRLERADFPWRPPVALTVRARFSAPADRLVGTGGFGFWNDPLGMSGDDRLARPQAVWFMMASASSEMALARGVPGHGWKAAVLDATGPAFAALLPLAPLAMPLMHVPALYERLWPIGQRALGAAEAALDVDPTAWHRYELSWRTEGCRFAVDGTTVLETAHSPPGPLGFVAWLDNQYAVVTPWGRFERGREGTDDTQWLEIAELRAEAGA